MNWIKKLFGGYGPILAAAVALIALAFPYFVDPFMELWHKIYPATRVLAFALEVGEPGKTRLIPPQKGVRSGDRVRLMLRTEFEQIHVRVAVFDAPGHFITVCKGGENCSLLNDGLAKQVPEHDILRVDKNSSDELMEIVASATKFPIEPPVEGQAPDWEAWKSKLPQMPKLKRDYESYEEFRVVRSWMKWDKIINVQVRIPHLQN